MGYLPGLDGIRALAVIGVLLYHADVTWIRGGFLGVDVFFVLSGFLITTLIIEEFDRSGTVDFKKFYIRRGRRLLPALIAVLIVVGLLATFIATDVAASTRADIIAAMTYSSNWWFIIQDQSYFEAIGRPPLLQHLWSLAVEEQFYFVWPALAFVLLKWRGRKGVGQIAFLLAIASTVWMIVLSVRGGFPLENDPSRAYFGADSHCMGLLLGAAMATIWRPGLISATVTWLGRAVINTIGIIALGAIVLFFLRVGEYSPWMYHGGFLLLAFVVCVLIAAASHPAASFGRVLGAQPMRYVGERSYGLYLWHWPIFMVMRPSLDVPVTGVAHLALVLGVTVVVAELSYRFIEMPIRHGIIGRTWTAWTTGGVATRSRISRRVITVGAPAVLLVGLGAGLLWTVPAANQPTAIAADVAQAIGIDNGGASKVTITKPSATPTVSPTTPGGSPSGTPTANPTSSSDPTSSSSSSPDSSGSSSDPGESSSVPKNSNGVMTGVGDSVMLGAHVTLERLIPGTQVDAEVSRQADVVLERILALKADDLLAPTVLIHTGTNGTVTEEQLRDMLDALKDVHRVIVMNTHVPRSWEQTNNETIANVVPDYPNAVIADWASVSDGHDEYFVSDGVHLTGPGMHAYGRLVLNLVNAP